MTHRYPAVAAEEFIRFRNDNAAIMTFLPPQKRHQAAQYPSYALLCNPHKKDYIQKLQKIPFFIVLDSSTKVPFKNLYSSPTTLGIDRIALAAAAVSLYPQKNTLIIDAGTCITYDFVNLKSEYLGGAISPGIDIRYQSLHHYTSKLPKLIKSEAHNLIGTSTSEAIHSGVINGVIHEIEGVIRQYELDFHDLTIVLTGGDTKFLFKQLKNSIFANQNFLLHGLNKILTFNNQ